MIDQLDVLRHTVDTLDRLRIPYVIVGSYACNAYGEARQTQDIGVVVDLPDYRITDFCAAFPDPYYLSVDAVRSAVQTNFQFNVLHPESANKIDFILPGKDEWGRGQLERCRSIRLLPDRDVNIASPEDVILGKMWYFSEGGSDKHLRDIVGILKNTPVDCDEVQRWAEKLGYSSIWETILKKLADTNEKGQSYGNA